MTSNSMRNKIRIFYAAILYHVAGRHKSARLCWRMLLATALILLFAVSGCSSMGTRGIQIDVTKEGAHVSYESGTAIKDGFNGTMFIGYVPSISRYMVFIQGNGGAVDPTEGHKATAAVVKDSLNAAIAGAKMGFAPEF